MLAALLDAVVEAVVWMLGFVLGELPERPRWLRRLIAGTYVLVVAACVVYAVMLLA